MQAALALLPRHTAQSEPPRLLEDGGKAGDEPIWVPFPAGLVALANHCHGRHEEQGDVILPRVLNEWLPFAPLPGMAAGPPRPSGAAPGRDFSWPIG